MSDASLTAGPLAALIQADSFVQRHIGPGADDRQYMLKALDAESLDALIDSTVPAAIRRKSPMQMAAPLDEHRALAQLRAIADGNQVFRSYIGLGYYDTLTPPVILRNIVENPAWYTAYTPYQPEISQGRLEGLLNFQQMILDLTGMELANASLLDEATAAAEAMALVKRVNKKSRSNRFFVADDCLPQTLAVIQTRARGYGFEIVVGDPETDLDSADVFGALLQYPGSDGRVRDLRPIIDRLHNQGGLAVVAADLLGLTLLTPPGELDADVAIGSAQRFGVPMGFGGPHAAYMATRDAYKRSMPGRIIGVSVDRHGNTALRMAMQTREQHIRREKATSNICTSQALLAICASSYAVYHGPEGLTAIARRVHRLTQVLAQGLRQLGFAPEAESFFDTVTIPTGDATTAIAERAVARRMNLRRVDENRLGISLDETTCMEDVADLWTVFAGRDVSSELQVATLDAQIDTASAWPRTLDRQSGFMAHPVFHRYRSETEMMRYLEKLARKDIALNQAMIALGSCTMKLNAAAEMAPITWPEFAHMHPFAPLDQAGGYRQLFDELEQMLVQATGYAAVSLQPNAGSQGEYAGLLAIRRYLDSRDESHRDICLIPSSAHGTNPASAAMAGMRVVIVECDSLGNVDMDDLDAKIERHRDELAAIMVTYPSTHGVFEEGIIALCEKVHAAGGQVYVDGANLNALVGIAAPGQFGADVSHLNLHKTFCIPHGGGGPGMGPIAVGAHLAPFLPSHPVQPVPGLDSGNDVIAAAPWGSASILPISWMYMRMMGSEGLTRATEVAILNANYIAHRLAPHYPVLYTGRNGRVAHECIIDLRPLKEATDISEEDVAKRLVDYGFHAPTMSFPVPGTLMVEPTESESLAEIERFCEAMIRIREEIAQVHNGSFDAADNPLRNAPHTAGEVCADSWTHPYSRELAAYPSPAQREFKYWPPVARIDNVYGDRNLFCACPGVDSYR